MTPYKTNNAEIAEALVAHWEKLAYTWIRSRRIGKTFVYEVYTSKAYPPAFRKTCEAFAAGWVACLGRKP